jgi:glycoprotein endo-alpha-1,2-mannosidase
MKKASSSKIILLTLTIPILVLVFYSISPTTSGLQNEMVEGYLYKLILETTSDWTTMEILGGPLIVSYNYTITQGSDAPDLGYTISPNFIWIGKKALDTTPVRIDVEVIALRGGDARIVIKKGDIGSTKISIQVWRSGGYSQIYSMVNEGANPQYPGTNDRIFYIDLEQLYKQPITTIIYQPTPKEFEKCVLAFYYPWYGTPHGPSRIWFHWEGVSGDSIANAAHYPLLGVYDSQDERLIEAHILLAKSSGIDGFIVSWWGINSFEDRSLEKIIKIAEKHDFKITIYYESYRPWNPPSIKQIIDELSYIVAKYSKSSAFIKVDGKPVIFIFAVESHERRPEFWLQIRRSLEEKVGSTYLVGDTRSPNYLHVFDGFHTYIELNREVMKNLYISYNASMRIGLAGQDFKESVEALKSGNPITIQEKTLFYTVIPGYDDRKIRSPGNYLDRMNGETYREFWEDALSSGARRILITSWNELHEGTEIEPTIEYGFLFLNITREYSNILKQVSAKEKVGPQLDIKFTLNEKNELLIRILNSGKGAMIATKIQILYPPETEIHITEVYQQPGKRDSTIIIIPIIKEQEEYTLSLRFRDLPRDKITMKINYYSTNGTPYATEASLITIWKISTTTLTKTLTVTTTSTTISTEKIIEKHISTMTTTISETVIPQSITFTLLGLIIIVIILSAILGYIAKRKTKTR